MGKETKISTGKLSLCSSVALLKIYLFDYMAIKLYIENSVKMHKPNVAMSLPPLNFFKVLGLT